MSASIGNGYPKLHQFGMQIAAELGISVPETGGAPSVRDLPTWVSKLRINELAYDSIALASVSMCIARTARTVKAKRGIHALLASVKPKCAHDFRIDIPTVQASFGSEQLFRYNGEKAQVWNNLSGFWRVADGWVRTHGNYPHHAERLAGLLGVSTDASLETIANAMATWERFVLEAQASQAGGLAIAVRTPQEWQHNPQYTQINRKTIIRSTHVPNAIPRPWPDWGSADTTVESDCEFNALPLAGIKVLDLTRVIAGPIATRDLALAGAEVLRVDSPRYPELRWQHLDTGQHKRTTILDLDDPDDLAKLHALIPQADVIVHGYRPHALTKYGIKFSRLAMDYPGIIVAQVSAWSTSGAWSTRRGFDSLVQAASGIAWIERTGDLTPAATCGGVVSTPLHHAGVVPGAVDEAAIPVANHDTEWTPGCLPVQALDHAAGHLLAAAITNAITKQRQSGGSFDLKVNLARLASALIQAGPPESQPVEAPSAPLPTIQVQVAGTDDMVTCAPPPIDFPGAPRTYAALHEWGSDAPVWLDALPTERG